jgi:predicted phosphate transport protein (TIGR00153 family)
MLGTIFNLFGRSPFAPLQSHMENVSGCVHLLPSLFHALEECNYEKMEEIAQKIGELEHQADIKKNDIRNHLPKSLFLPIDRGHLLEILSIQDKIADKTEDVAVLVTLKQLELLPSFRSEFMEFLHKNISAFDSAQLIVKEMHELLESSFGGTEAEKVCDMIEQVAFKEHEVDLIQRKLLKKLFLADSEMNYSSFYLWQKVCIATADISNLSENLAFRIRMTLELRK